MAGNIDSAGGRYANWRMAAWASATAFILLLPLVAMQFTEEVNWTGSDFVFAGVLILGTGITYEAARRMTGNHAYRAAIGMALVAAFLLIWINAAVGIIGSEDNPANLMYGGVLAVAIIGALIARLRPQGMARALSATALAQALVGVIAMVAGMGYPASPPLEILGVNGIFVALWLVSAWLFRQAERSPSPIGRGP